MHIGLNKPIILPDADEPPPRARNFTLLFDGLSMGVLSLLRCTSFRATSPVLSANPYHVIGPTHFLWPPGPSVHMDFSSHFLFERSAPVFFFQVFPYTWPSSLSPFCGPLLFPSEENPCRALFQMEPEARCSPGTITIRLCIICVPLSISRLWSIGH